MEYGAIDLHKLQSEIRVIDDAGAVVGVVARGCAPSDMGPCVPASVGVPVRALRRQ